jgi:hypothetical protein
MRKSPLMNHKYILKNLPIIDAVFDVLPEDEPRLFIEHELCEGEAVEGGGEQTPQLYQLLLIGPHRQARVVDNKHLPQHGYPVLINFF